MTTDLRRAIDESPMSRYQWTAISICILLNVLDGYDVLAMAFTSTSVSDDWNLSTSVLGVLLSAGLFGMAIGSLSLAPLADIVGRRKLILACLVLSSGGMMLSAVSQNATQLGILRVLTGVGIGGILACSNVIGGELASNRWRGLAVSLNSTGYAIGATIGGLAALLLVDTFGWRSVFLVGGVCTAALIPLVLWRLPESIDFLTVRQPAGALDRINAFAGRIGHPPLRELPAATTTGSSKGGVVDTARQLFDRQNKRTTLLIWTAFFFTMFGFYFVTSWTPKLLVEAGMSAKEGITGGMILNLGGILGTFLLGALAARFRLARVLVAYLVVSAALMTIFVPAAGVFALALVVGFGLGIVVNGCIAGLYALTATSYPAPIRATGMGWAIGMGRIGAILSPLVAGALLDADWSPTSLYMVMAVLFVAAAVAVMAMSAAGRQSTTGVAGAVGTDRTADLSRS
ncbi:MFS transporter [Gordonia sp. PKS22-38]|uniref:MFS transporter n=1 Tax=Gordonia prachuapensis TaxID=3115651 RepID=A0ABU7MU10_9ACTN|nr:MFS transporter [Gordonia sp. PKS22-38]